MANSTTGCESGYSNTLEISTFDLGGANAQAPTPMVKQIEFYGVFGSNVTLDVSAQRPSKLLLCVREETMPRAHG